MNKTDSLDTGIIFLGVCERAAYVRDGYTNLFKWNVVGLKRVVLSYIFPCPLPRLYFNFAIYGSVARSYHISLVNSVGKELGWLDLSATVVSAEAAPDSTKDNPVVHGSTHGWIPIFVHLNNPEIVIQTPGVHYLTIATDTEPIVIGEIFFAELPAPPLTIDRIAAILSDPKAAKAVILEIACKSCSGKIRTYAALERSEKIEEDCVWYTNLPNEFQCTCGTIMYDCSSIRRNLHGVLGRRVHDEGQLEFIPIYEKGLLEDIRSRFAMLLDVAEREEEIQKAIEENPILLHQFPSERLLFKPAILTFFNADFAIVTPQRELILIEIERPDTQLLKKGGGVAAPLTHAFDQVNDWLHVVDEHRLAVLDSLKIPRESVSKVRGVVIAGRDAGYDAKHLRKLKGTDRGKIAFLTFDDLVSAMDALIAKMDAI